MFKEIVSQKIVYVGIDVHKSKYVLCALEKDEKEAKHFKTTSASTEEVFKFIEKLKDSYGKETVFVCGYEPGPCGYHLKDEINQAGGCCSIVPIQYITPFRLNSKIKTDRRDAEAIAKTLKSGNFYEVYTPDEEDEQVKNYLRLRDHKCSNVKRIKQQIKAFLLLKGLVYGQGTRKKSWTGEHRKWIREQKLNGLDQLVLDEMLVELETAEQSLKRVDQKIEEIAQSEKYSKHVQMLRCFIGIEYLTALCFIVEVGDFERFATPGQLASFIGLVPGEHSSGNSRYRSSMTNAGNKRLRTKAVLVAQHMARTDPNRKTKTLILKQEGNSAEMIAYADKANRRCAEKFRRLFYSYGKPRNVAIGAVAREVVNFIWGAMTGHIA